jgi:hypothetical protein
VVARVPSPILPLRARRGLRQRGRLAEPVPSHEQRYTTRQRSCCSVRRTSGRLIGTRSPTAAATRPRSARLR